MRSQKGSHLPSILLSFGLLQAASALVIRHDTPTTTYENYARTVPIWNTSTPNFRASDTDFGISGASAIDSRWGVHARHTLRAVQDWLADGNSAVTRGRTFNAANNTGFGGSGGGVQVVQVIHFDDDFSRFANAIDIAVVEAAAPTSAQAIAPLFTGTDEVGRIGNMVSAANNRRDGNGVDRRPENEANSVSGRPTETTWAADNMVDQTNGQGLGSPANALLRVDFDNPDDPSDSLFGSNQALDLEAGTMGGDSGSPIYIDKNGLNGQIAGVLSGGTGNTYGTSVVYVRISPYVTWITDTILAIPDNRTLEFSSPNLATQTVPVGTELAFRATANSSEVNTNSPSVDTLTRSYSLVSAPAGATIDSATGQFSWTPQSSDAGLFQTITIQAQENGVVANSAEQTFNVFVPAEGIPFWDWSGAAPNWTGISVGGGSSFSLASANFPFLQGNATNLIYQQVSGTLPAGSTVRITVKLADFNQAWSQGGPIEFGFRDTQPTVANAGAPFLASHIANVPAFVSADGLVNGLGNTDQPVLHSFVFQTDTDLTDPWFAVRKNADGDRFSVDDISITYSLTDGDGDGLSDSEELALGTNPTLFDTDGDGFSDSFEVNFLGTNPILFSSPGAANGLPYASSFESDFGGWLQVQDDDIDWTRNSGGTESGAAGPSGASTGDFYLYYEGHDTTVAFKSASIEQTFNFTGSTSPQLTFDYHMYGAFIDFLAVDVHDGTTWTEKVFELDGPQHFSSEEPWLTATVDLSAFADLPSVTLRFRHQQTQFHSADPAIDNVILVDTGINTPAIGINFVSSNGLSDGNPLSNTTLAGAPGVPQRNWNNTESLTGSSGTTARIASPLSGTLVDSEGNATSTQVSFTMNNAWSAAPGAITSYNDLLGGYLDTNNANDASVTLSQIPYPQYNVFVYFGAGTNGRTGQVTDGTTTYSFATATNNPDLIGTYQQTFDTGAGNPSANFAVFTGKTDSSVTIDYLRGSGNGGIHAIQIVPVGLLLTPYQEWAATVFLGAPAGTDVSETGNPDGDRYTNIEEWVLVTDPLIADDPILSSSEDGGNFTITYNRRSVGTPAVRAAWSEDLLPNSWRYDGDGLTESLLSTEGDIESMSATIPMNGPRRFMRLEIYDPSE